MNSKSGASGVINICFIKKQRNRYHLLERGRENSSFPVEEGSESASVGIKSKLLCFLSVFPKRKLPLQDEVWQAIGFVGFQ